MNILGEKHAGIQVFSFFLLFLLLFFFVFVFVLFSVLFCFVFFFFFISTCRDTQAYVNSRVRKYTQKGAA